MRRNIYRYLLILLLQMNGFAAVALAKQHPHSVRLDTLTLNDETRNRAIPIAIYQADTKRKLKPLGLVVLSHGYNQNKGQPYLFYSFIANFLALKGYFVVSIQHELPSDSLMPTTGIPQVVRRPFWERGADNILFVLKELKNRYPQLIGASVALIGHSNGGDITALFPQKYPGYVNKIITLDNRRVALPKTNFPKVYSLRSCDQPADAGVLPDAAEQQTLGITIVPLQATLHNDMCDFANKKQRKEMCKYIALFLAQ